MERSGCMDTDVGPNLTAMRVRVPECTLSAFGDMYLPGCEWGLTFQSAVITENIAKGHRLQ